MRPRAALVLALLLVAPLALAAPPTTVASLPEPLVGAAVAVAGDAAYVLGGRNATSSYSDAILRHDPASGTVSQVGTLPIAVGMTSGARYSGSAAAIGTTIYHFGGSGIQWIDLIGDGELDPVPRALPDIVAFDTQTGTATTLADRLPHGAWGMSNVVIGGDVYLFGGFTFDFGDPTSTGRHDWILRFDPNALPGARVTELGTKLPYKLQDSAAVAFGDVAYVAGGLADHAFPANACPTYEYVDPETGQNVTGQIQVCISAGVIRFDAAAGSASVAAELPARVQFVAGAKVGDVGVVPGGLRSDGTAGAQISQIDPARPNPIRSLVDALPTPLFGAPVGVLAGAAHVYGGRVGSSGDLTDAVVRLDPDGDVLAAGPGPVRDLAATGTGALVSLAWSAPDVDATEPAASHYLVLRLKDGEPEVLLGTTSATSWNDAVLDPATTYRYRVVPVSTVGNGTPVYTTYPAIAPPPPPPPPPNAPSAPRNLTARSEGIDALSMQASVELRWDAPASNGGSPVAGYRVFRSVDGGEPHEIALVMSRRYVDHEADPFATSSYRVAAYNVAGTSPRSAPADVAFEDHVRALVPV